MTTLLEHILTRYLGEPTSMKGAGESYWPCPMCGHPRYHTMPAHPHYKNRALCWRCGFRGDAADMLREFHNGHYEWPHLPDYGDRLQLLEMFRREWEEQRVGIPLSRRGVPKRTKKPVKGHHRAKGK